jgi:hypothetical protein
MHLNFFLFLSKTPLFVAGMLNVVIANPLWVGATRMRSGQQDQMRQQKAGQAASKDANTGEAHEGDAAAAAAVAAEVSSGTTTNNGGNDTDSPGKSDGATSTGPVRAAEYGGVLGLVRLLLAIGKREGVGKLWSGTAAGLVLVSNPAIHFGALLSFVVAFVVTFNALAVMGCFYSLLFPYLMFLGALRVCHGIASGSNLPTTSFAHVHDTPVIL